MATTRRSLALTTYLADAGLGLVLAERMRQVEQLGYTPEHDDQHVFGQLAVAAMLYALPSAVLYSKVLDAESCSELTLGDLIERVGGIEEWNLMQRRAGAHDQFDPDSVESIQQRITDLGKASALILAELERQLRRLGSA